MAQCCDAQLDENNNAVGEPTEAALVNYAYALGLPKGKLNEKQPRIGEAPFDSGRKMMSTVHKTDEGFIQYTKGAPDEILKKCTQAIIAGKTVPMTDDIRKDILRANKAMADRALRVLAVSLRQYKKEPASYDAADLEQELVFVGLTGMIDPVRPEVKAAIEECREAGIRPVMITGDHKDTAVAIGKELGIIHNPEEAIVGAELDKFTDEELVEEVLKYSVYARVQPEHKTRIVKAWKARGMVTAMTGDGVNDAPSIKSADIGIGMGITGTDVTKGASDMVLADDNFATIVNAVEEGRKIYDNVCKVLQFQLSTNMSEVIIMFVASILNFTILSPVHLLWVNMVTDSLPGLALGMEKAEGNLMRRKPRATTDGIFSGGAGVDMVWQGVYLALIEIAAFVIGFFMEHQGFGFVETLKMIWGANEMDKGICANAICMAFLAVNFGEMFCAIQGHLRERDLHGVSRGQLRRDVLRYQHAFPPELHLLKEYVQEYELVADRRVYHHICADAAADLRALPARHLLPGRLPSGHDGNADLLPARIFLGAGIRNRQGDSPCRPQKERRITLRSNRPIPLPFGAAVFLLQTPFDSCFVLQFLLY